MTHSFRSLSRTARILAIVAGLWLCLPGAVSAAEIHWDAPIEWTPWEQAMAKAKAENKPICLVVYANWCPKCRKIAPFFKKPEMLAAAKKAVMVLQNDEDKPGWLVNEFGASGNYVPRIFFLDRGGNIDHDINSGNQKFPFFYRPNDAGIAKLVAAIDKAAKKVGGPAQAAAPQPAPVAAVAGNAVGAGQNPANTAPVAVAPGQPQPPAEEPSDLPIILGLVVAAVGAAWFVGRGNG